MGDSALISVKSETEKAYVASWYCECVPWINHKAEGGQVASKMASLLGEKNWVRVGKEKVVYI